LRSEQHRETGDEGFSVVEMLVALAVLSVTMLASAPFFIKALTNVNKQRTMQTAIQLANTSMEHVRGLKGSSLLSGRSVKATQAQFDIAPASVRPYLQTMEVAGDPVIKDVNSTVGATAPISTSVQKVTIDGIEYDQNIYVGNCEVYLTGTNTECVYPKGAAAPSDSTKILQFFRVVIQVTWADSTCKTVDGRCGYIATTLISRASEPTFDFNRPSPQVMENKPVWYVGDPVSYQMEARGGQLPNTWTITALPVGLTMSAYGVISGTPTTATVLNATATVSDKYSRNNSAAVTFTVVRPPTVTMPPNTTSQVGKTVSLKATAANGVPAYQYKVEGLPAGLTFDTATGAIGGAATTVGTYAVTVTVTDVNGKAVTGTYTHVVLPALVLGALADQTFDLGTALDLVAVASGGDGNYTYSVTGLPPGPSIRSTDGTVSGRPTATGRFLPTITVTDGTGATASRQIVVIINSDAKKPSLVFTAPSLTAADRTSARNVATSLNLTTNGTLLGLSPVITVSGLPPGLSYNALTGTISGTPTTTGVYRVTASASALTPPSNSYLNFVWTIT
jgi:prepilin-type N-terminal cleavage/methylation domain-containing protein